MKEAYMMQKQQIWKEFPLTVCDKKADRIYA